MSMAEKEIPTLYEATLKLYDNRHRKLTMHRLASETGLKFYFVAHLRYNIPVTDETLKKVEILHDKLVWYENNPDKI